MEIPGLGADNALARIVACVCAQWPEHARFLQASFSQRTPAALDETIRMAELIERLAGPNPVELAHGYRWMCEMILAEEIEFRRTGHYRFSTFAEANAAVYQNQPLMEKYLNGILLSHVLWANHAMVFEYYAKAFLAKNRPEYRHLEVGPGHGLLLYEAASDRRCGSVTGWDVSPTSLSHTEACLKRLGVERPVALAERDLMAGELDGQFDSIVISEVLEHLERPDMALSRLGSVLAPGGFLFAHVPINSPTVDHIYLWRLPEDFIDLVRRSGFEVVDCRCVPCTGYSERQARRMALTISCAVIATAAA